MKDDLFITITNTNEQLLFCTNIESDLICQNSNERNYSTIDFSEIYSKYYFKLIRFATDFVVYEEDAENIIQDVFLGLWEKRDSLAFIENMNAYIFKLVKNKCLDHLKHKISQEKYVTNVQFVYEQEFSLKLQSLENFDVDVASEEKMEKIIADAIDSLPGKCREIFLLSRYEGLKYREISEYLNLSVNTVETQMSIALKKLRQKLKSYLFS